MQYVKIPRERIGALIGEEGATRKDIEDRTKTKLTVDDTSVSIEGESLDEWIGKDVVRAIGRGFSPEKALSLLQENMGFELVNLSEVVGGSEKTLARVKGRIIGTDGKVRSRIEDLTECFISVYGKTVGVIGSLEDTPLALEAILRIASGSPHSNVFRFLERQRTPGRIA